MSDRNGSAWPLVHAFLLTGVLVAAAMVTCSNSRLEARVIQLQKSLESRPAGGGGARFVRPAGGSDAPEAVEGPVRTPGQGSGVIVAGWGGRQAEVTFVEGAVPNAPLRLEDKPLPQADWYTNRRNSPPRNLNYYITSEGETERITQEILGRLLRPDPDEPEKPQPMLATSWEVSEDKLTYTYRLRKGVQFADGRPFTADDVKFTFEVMRDPEVRADHLRPGFDDVESLTSPDPWTVVVRYRKRYWAGVYAVGAGLRVLNKGWYEEMIPKYAAKEGVAKYSIRPGTPGFGETFNKIRVPCPGTEGYYLASDDDYKTQSLELNQNPFCWSTQVHPEWHNLRKLRWIFISDEVAAFEAFRKGEFDVTVVDADRWEDQLQKDPTIHAIAKHFRYDHMALDCSYVAWNCRRPPFDDARVRTAMTHLADREWLLREIERGRGSIAVCKSKREYATYSKDLVPHPFDVEKAKALLAEAGWRDSDGDGVLDRNGKRFEVELKVPSGRTFFQRVGGQIQEACRKAGIRLSIRSLEWATFSEDYDKREFDGVMLYNSWPDPWIDNYDSYHSSADVPNGGNMSGWRDPRADKLLAAMREEFDDAKRTAMFHEFNRLFYDAQPMTLLVHGMVDVLQNKRFEGARVRPTGMRNFDLWVKPENVLHK